MHGFNKALRESGELAGVEGLADPKEAKVVRAGNAVRAHLLELAGDHQAAIAHYRAAAGRTTSLPERNYLSTQAARLGERTMSRASDDSTS
jgi:predicted RNA polymerase sigma factor